MTNESLYLGERQNEYGTPTSAFRCCFCGDEFTICPAVSPDKRHLYEEDGCGAAECDSYNPSRDANILFGDYGMFNRYCTRKGLDPHKLSHLLLSGKTKIGRQEET